MLTRGRCCHFWINITWICRSPAIGIIFQRNIVIWCLSFRQKLVKVHDIIAHYSLKKQAQGPTLIREIVIKTHRKLRLCTSNKSSILIRRNDSVIIQIAIITISGLQRLANKFWNRIQIIIQLDNPIKFITIKCPNFLTFYQNSPTFIGKRTCRIRYGISITKTQNGIFIG